MAPLLRALGYGVSGFARMVRSRALDHPYVQFGVTEKPIKIIPDYLLEVNGKPRWVLDAKSPREPVDEPEHVAQAYSYAIHHEVRAGFYAICNGRELIVYSVAQLEPRLRVNLRELNDRWQEVLQFLFPPAMTHDPSHPYAKDFGLHLFRLGVSETADLGFPGSPIRNVSRVGHDLYTGFAMNPNSEGQEYAVSFDFDGEVLNQLLAALPEGVARQVETRLQGPPIQVVWLPGGTPEELPKVTIWARRTTEFVENDRELYLPLTVTRIDPFSG